MASRQRTGAAREVSAQPAGWPTRLARGAVIALIHVYQGVASVFPKVCRFEPSCSNYGLEAVRVHGAATGGWLTLKRILRCRPGGGFGVDPVPPAGAVHGGCRHADDHAQDAPDDPSTGRRAAR